MGIPQKITCLLLPYEEFIIVVIAVWSDKFWWSYCPFSFRTCYQKVYSWKSYISNLNYKVFFSNHRRIWGGKDICFVSTINFNFIIFFFFSGFHLKLPRGVDPQEHSGSQSYKILSQSGDKPFQTSQVIERSSQGDPVDDENRITQTPLDTLRDKPSLDVSPRQLSDTGR